MKARIFDTRGLAAMPFIHSVQQLWELALCSKSGLILLNTASFFAGFSENQFFDGRKEIHSGIFPE